MEKTKLSRKIILEPLKLCSEFNQFIGASWFNKNFFQKLNQFLVRLNPLDIIDGKLQEIQTKASLNIEQVMAVFYEIGNVKLRPGTYRVSQKNVL